MGGGAVLDHVDECMERFLRAAVPLSARDIDVSFEAPDRAWAGKLNNRPTINLFLWDIRRSTAQARAGMETYVEDGKTKQRMPLPRVELRYLVTAWTAEHADSRALMGGLMRSLLAHTEIPAEFVAEPLSGLSPMTIMFSRGDDVIDVVRALDGQLKVALDITVTTEVDTKLGRPVAAPVAEIGISIADREVPGRESRTRRVAGQVAAPEAVGRRVTTPHGTTVVDSTGRFLVVAQPGDALSIDLDPPLTAVVPERGGVVIG
jgi:hypothetical protein